MTQRTLVRSLTDPGFYVGTVTGATAGSAVVNLPHAAARTERRGLSRGTVGDFVFVDCEDARILGRIVEVKVPDRERLALEPKIGSAPDSNPIGLIQLLATVRVSTRKLRRGVASFPKVGDAVFLADPSTVSQLFRSATHDDGGLNFIVGELDTAFGSEISLSAEKLFGRHCGVLGATGGGKSWTVASLIEQVAAAGGRAFLFDPTGEFGSVAGIKRHLAFGRAENGETLVYFPYTSMTESDLFALVNPSGQSQGPRLRDAVQSLKLVSAMRGQERPGLLVDNGLIYKRGQPRKPFLDALIEYGKEVNLSACRFDIEKLSDQIANECVRTGAPGKWGGDDQQMLSYCETMIARIRTQTNSAEMQCLFGREGEPLAKMLREFVSSQESGVIRISFKHVSFEHNTRELLMNIIGRYLLNCARNRVMSDKPVLVFLDEAHQFIGRIIGDTYGNVSLDAFGLIAKEGRKYGLNVILATQRPRDIPADVLSQLGTLIVHRLTNEGDRSIVEKACGDLDREAARFIPTLGPGEAIIIGPDVPAPLPVKIREPSKPPQSDGPRFARHWGVLTPPQSSQPAPPPPASHLPRETPEISFSPDDVPAPPPASPEASG
ncbi:ATP-binding protein [Salinarimonas sp.]|uniref:ATP-binding protein n=1 Tax=Salinarimonas sp. TaxID=2766526 RepID=UPI0032D90191